MDPDKETRSDAKLKNLSKEALDELWGFRNPEDDEDKVMSFREIQAEVPLRYGFTVSLGVLSDFYRWLKLKRRFEASMATADQVREELERAPDFPKEKVREAVKRVFATEAMTTGKANAYIALERLVLQRGQQDLDARRVAILEKKAAFADAVKEAAANRTGGVTAEEMAEIERKLKIM